MNNTLINHVKSQDIAGVAAALTDGADVNYKDSESRSALHYAAAAGNVSILKILINAGADVNIQDADEMTPLHYAACGRIPAIKVDIDDASNGILSINI